MAEKRPNNYFDDIPTSHRQIKVFMIIVLAYIFDQMDNMVLGYVAPSVMRSFGIGMQEFAPAQSLYFFGMMLGGIVAGVISDKFGRRKAFMLGCFTFSTATILTGMTDNIYTFTLWRVITGFAVLGTGAISFTYLAETISSQDRSKWSGIVVGVGHISIPFIGFIAMEVVPMGPEAWRWLFYQGVIGYIPLVLAYFFMKESPRWLIANGRQAEAEAVVEAYTGVPVDLTAVAEQYRKTVAQKLTVAQTFKKIFDDKKYLYRTLVLFCVAAGQNIPSFVFLGWNTTLLQQIGISQADSLLISTVGALGIPLGVIASGYVGPLGGRKISIGVQILLVGALISAYMNVGTNDAHDPLLPLPVRLHVLRHVPQPVHVGVLFHRDPQYRHGRRHRRRPLHRGHFPADRSLPLRRLVLLRCVRLYRGPVYLRRPGHPAAGLAYR